MTAPSSRGVVAWLAIGVALLLVGCSDRAVGVPTAAGSSGARPAAAQPRASLDPAEQARAYAQCIRANGVPAFPDPNPDGQFMLVRGSGISFGDPKFQAAQQACQDLRPAGFGTAQAGPGGPLQPGIGGPDPSQTMLAFARCMRQNGFPDFPDPAPGGRIVIGPGTGVDPNDPRFQNTVRACSAAVTEQGR